MRSDTCAEEDASRPRRMLEAKSRGTDSMRLWHLVLLILASGIVLTIIRDPVGRIALIVFITAVGEVAFGTTAVMALFQTIGAIGMARGLFEHTQAVAATTLVLIV